MSDELSLQTTEQLQRLILSQERLLKQLTLDGDVSNVILAVCLISTVSTLTRLKEQFRTCSTEKWGSPSELRGTAVRFRLPFSITETTLENTLELMRILIFTSPGWRTILEKTSEDFYVVEGAFWDAIHDDLKLD